MFRIGFRDFMKLNIYSFYICSRIIRAEALTFRCPNETMSLVWLLHKTFQLQVLQSNRHWQCLLSGILGQLFVFEDMSFPEDA